MRRPCPDIVFGEQTMVATSQEDLLSNKNNKSHLIAVLKLRLVEAGVRVVQDKDDADSYQGNPAILVGTDTDLLVMLIYRIRPNGSVKMLHPSTNNTSAKLYDIAAIQKDIGDMRSAILFAHAVTGGDKISAVYGKGKIKAYKLLRKNVSLRSEVVNFLNSPASHPEEVANTGERFVRALYPGGDKVDDIVDLRLHLYNRAVDRQALAASFKLSVLPPTKAALYQHSLRTSLHVYPTAYGCMKRRRDELLPTDWGWHFSNSQDTLMPVLTSLPPAPSFLMRIISCKCKRDCNAPCSCRKAGERCSDMC
ncbi:hypothetical protein PR048_030600 [Dryococelus australis]|uniref:Uncharacterized protein n=1 Tax=Dryococelus australis TaxID=614101 RepID=A0ABQ9G9F2_9NEOP|nr:hypothetical protein PR048_030600 [Dryococelus australis]